MKQILSALLSAGMLALVCLIGAHPAAASTLTMDLKGFLTSTFTAGTPNQDLYGTDVTGNMAFTDGTTSGNSTTFNHVTWSFTVDGVVTTSGARDFPGGQVNITNSGSDIAVGLNSVFGDFQINFDWGPTAQMLSLANFPAKQTVAASLYGWLSGNGNFFKNGTTYIFNVFKFNANVTTAGVTATPIPGSLWLLLSGLIGMGGIAWRRQRQPAGAVA
jgi:hypothetical protein